MSVLYHLQISSLLVPLVQLVKTGFTKAAQRLDGIYALLCVSKIAAVDIKAGILQMINFNLVHRTNFCILFVTAYSYATSVPNCFSGMTTKNDAFSCLNFLFFPSQINSS